MSTCSKCGSNDISNEKLTWGDAFKTGAQLGAGRSGMGLFIALGVMPIKKKWMIWEECNSCGNSVGEWTIFKKN